MTAAARRAHGPCVRAWGKLGARRAPDRAPQARARAHARARPVCVLPSSRHACGARAKPTLLHAPPSDRCSLLGCALCTAGPGLIAPLPRCPAASLLFGRYTAIAGATWAESILKTLFGYQPKWPHLQPKRSPGHGTPQPRLWQPHLPRGFTGLLSGIRQPGVGSTLLAINATPSGVAIAPS